MMERRDYLDDGNNLVRITNEEGVYLVDSRGNRVGGTYSFIIECGCGQYVVGRHLEQNVMRPDGSLVLKKWHKFVHFLHNGFFLFSDMISTSETNQKPYYVYGLANCSGDVIFPEIFTDINDEAEEYFDAKIGDDLYTFSLDGSMADCAKEYLPTKVPIDGIELLNRIINWIFPGQQFFYRDTDAPLDVKSIYHEGNVIRAGFFIDVTTKLLRPVHKTRFIIASAHAAMLCRIDDLCENNPKVREWGLCTLHYNSYFKVMDVYEKDGVTQVFLMHIPETAVRAFGNGSLMVDFRFDDGSQEEMLVDMARKSLDEKLTMEVHPRSLDEVFVSRMYHPVGLDNDFKLIPLQRDDNPLNEEIANVGSFIHKAAQDADIEIYKKVDNFPYNGVKDTVCEGCIYTRGIRGNGAGCGRLFQKTFRKNYIRGMCDFKKTSLSTPSVFEKRDKEAKLANARIEKASDTYALNLFRSFINDKLGGDIGKLKPFNLASIYNDLKYGGDKESWGPKITKAILSLVFGDVWEDLGCKSLDKSVLEADYINTTWSLFDEPAFDYYWVLEKFDAPQSLCERVVAFEKKKLTIGNVMLLPTRWHLMRHEKNFRWGCTDVFIREFHNMMTGAGKIRNEWIGGLNLNGGDAARFRTEENFQRIVRGLMLDDFLDEEGNPKQVFQGVAYWDRGLKREKYLKAAEEFLDFCGPFIDGRADKIIEKLIKFL
ncbi:MAG: hypothetical protein LUD72_08235 [Bacteroidales bacterium]|nr:hypothetical protein [Bacteroidales bacterium]